MTIIERDGSNVLGPLPKGWCWTRLGKVVSQLTDGTHQPPKFTATGVPFIVIGNISGSRIDWTSVRKWVSVETYDKESKRLSPTRNDILYTAVGSYGTAVRLVDDRPFMFQRHIAYMRPIDAVVEPLFLCYALNSPLLRRQADDAARGVAQKTVTLTALRHFSLPLAPLAEQRRIAARIDALFAEIAEGEAALAQARKDIDKFRRALLKAAFIGELTRDWREANTPAETGHDLLARIRAEREHNGSAKGRRRRASAPAPLDTSDLPALPQSWAWARLSELGEFGRGKSRHRPRDDQRLYGGEMPFIQTGVIANSRDYISAHEQTYSEYGVAQSRVWPSGTVCITIAANIAKTAISTYECCFPDSVVGLKPVRDIDPLLVHLWMQTIQHRLEKFAPATAQKNINLEVLNGVAVPIPPPAEATEVLRRVSDALASAENTRAMLDAEATDATRLKQSVLKAAFEGRLVPQDPADEPASVLLAHINAQSKTKVRQRRGRPNCL